MGEELVAWGLPEDSKLEATSGFPMSGGCRDSL